MKNTNFCTYFEKKWSFRSKITVSVPQIDQKLHFWTENLTFSFWICSACCFSFCLISFSYVVVFFKPVILSSNVFAWPFLVQNVYFLEIGSFYSENVVKMAHFPTKNSKNDSSMGNFPIFVQKKWIFGKNDWVKVNYHSTSGPFGPDLVNFDRDWNIVSVKRDC